MTGRADLAFDQLAARFYRTGLSTYEVAGCLGSSQGRVARALKRMGMPLRSMAEAQRLHVLHTKERKRRRR